MKTGNTIISQNKRSSMQNVEDNCTNTCSLPRPVNYLLLLTYVDVRCCKKKVIQYILQDHLNADMNGINNLKPRAVTFIKSVKFKNLKETLTLFNGDDTPSLCLVLCHDPCHDHDAALSHGSFPGNSHRDDLDYVICGACFFLVTYCGPSLWIAHVF